MRISALMFVLCSATPLAAGPFDGLYRPDQPWAEGWDCKTVGSDGGALSIKDDLFQGVESQCRLTNPAPVTGMDAVLYDADCTADGETVSYRLMLMRTAEGIVVIEDGSVAPLARCD
jgi:hypothetical protein